MADSVPLLPIVLPIERLRGWYHTSDIAPRRDDSYLVYGYTAGPALALAVFRFSREKLATYKRIRRLQFSELPKTTSGKIRRVERRRRDLAREEAQSSRMPDEYWEEDFPDPR